MGPRRSGLRPFRPPRIQNQLMTGPLQVFDKSDDLPALRLRQFRPIRHSLSYNAVGHNPKGFARSGALHRMGAQARTALRSISVFAVTLGAMPIKQFFPGYF